LILEDFSALLEWLILKHLITQYFLDVYIKIR